MPKSVKKHPSEKNPEKIKARLEEAVDGEAIKDIDYEFFLDDGSFIDEIIETEEVVEVTKGAKKKKVKRRRLFYEMNIFRKEFERVYSVDAYREQIGVSLPKNEAFAEWDYRHHERSLMRFSPYFESVKRINSNTDLYNEEGFYPERYCSEHPTPFNGEEYGILLYEECEHYRRIYFNEVVSITVFNGGNEILLEGMDAECNELFLTRGIYTGYHSTPYFDYYLKKKLIPDISTTEHQIVAFDDEMSIDGGSLRLCFESRQDGSLYKTTQIDISLKKSKSEVMDTVYTVYGDNDDIKLRFNADIKESDTETEQI